MKVRIYFTDGRRGDIALDAAAWEQAQHDLAQYRRSGEPRARTYLGLDEFAVGGRISWTLTFPEIARMRRVPRPDVEGALWGLYRYFRRHFRVLRSLFRCAPCRYRRWRHGQGPGLQPSH